MLAYRQATFSHPVDCGDSGFDPKGVLRPFRTTVRLGAAPHPNPNQRTRCTWSVGFPNSSWCETCQINKSCLVLSIDTPFHRSTDKCCCCRPIGPTLGIPDPFSIFDFGFILWAGLQYPVFALLAKSVGPPRTLRVSFGFVFLVLRRLRPTRL